MIYHSPSHWGAPCWFAYSKVCSLTSLGPGTFSGPSTALEQHKVTTAWTSLNYWHKYGLPVTPESLQPNPLAAWITSIKQKRAVSQQLSHISPSTKSPGQALVHWLHRHQTILSWGKWKTCSSWNFLFAHRHCIWSLHLAQSLSFACLQRFKLSGLCF